jgi:hypothetical protein
MIAIVGMMLFCALLYRFVVYAVPAYFGFAAGFWALNHGVGFGCVVIGLIAGITTFLAGRFALTSSSRTMRCLIIAIFTLPAALAGYSSILELSASGIPSTIWQQAVAITGGMVAAVAVFARLVSPDNKSR